MIPASDTQPENDRELWNIIEKQRTIILELQKALNEVTLERDNLLIKSTAEETNNKSPIPPPRSPFRSTNKTKKDLVNGHNDDEQDDEQDTINLTPIQVKVKSIYTNSFVLSVINNKTNKELWQIEKLYTDLLSLDMAVNINFAPIAILSLKNNKLDFLFSNTSSLEKRWQLIDEYITSTLLLLKKDPSIMYSFLIEKKIIKKGYLTKRTIQGGKKYYFIMNHSQLNYFHRKNDQLWLGTIQLNTETRIGKQKQNSDSLFLHAFIILNSKSPAYKYILCAESDTERDEWVKVLHVHQSKHTIPRSHSDNSVQKLPHSTSMILPTIRHKTYQRSSMDDLALLKFYEASNLSSKISADSLPNIEDLDIKKKSANRKTFWSRKKLFPLNTEECIEASSTSSSSTTIATPSFQVFGVSLEEAIRMTRISKNFELPAIVYRCIEYLEAKDAIYEEGIYRQSGSSVQINNLRQQFCEHGDVDLLRLPQTDQVLDVNVVASLLKMWLRELPVNVLTHELLNDFLTVIDEENKKIRIKKLGHLVSMLPIANYSLLRTLIAHLIHIVHHADHNKMTLRNVGIVFAPTLSIPSGVFTLFMSDFDYIFWTRDKTTTSLPCLKSTRLEPSTSADRIKQQYLKAEESRSSRNSVTYKNNLPPSMMSLETKVKYHPLEHEPFMKENDHSAFYV